jgi:hypothetical protein
MAKIVICSNKKDHINDMLKALSEDHQVFFCDTKSSDYTESYLSTFDLIMDYGNDQEIRAGKPIKKCFEKGIPVLAGGYGNNRGAAMSIGISNKMDYFYSEVYSKIINDKDVISSDYNKKDIKHCQTGTYLYCIYDDNKSTPKDMIPLAIYRFQSGSYKPAVICVVFPKGSLNINETPFAADCAFIGYPFNIELTDDGMNIVNDVINWLLNKTYITAKVKDQDGNALPFQDVYLHSRATGDLISKYKSDENGDVVFRIRHKFDYYAVAFDKKGGFKNAVAIDNIIA